MLNQAAQGGDDADPEAWVAHVVEHAIIDRLYAITDVPSVNGATGVLEEPPHEMDLFVTAPDRGTGGLAATLGVAMVGASLNGDREDPVWSLATSLAHRFYRQPGRLIEPELQPERTAANSEDYDRALAMLEGTSFLERVPFSLNLSGLERYRHLRQTSRGPAVPWLP